jgi:hypothetical protein
MKTFRISSLAFAVCISATFTVLAQPGNLSSWKVLAEGGAEVEIAQVAATPPVADGQSTNALQITVKQTGQRFGVVCAEMGDTKLQTGEWYDVSFNAQTDSRKTYALIFSLESLDGGKVGARTTLPEVGRADWTHYIVALHTLKPVSKCRMVIALADTGSISLKDISVVLRKTN